MLFIPSSHRQNEGWGPCTVCPTAIYLATIFPFQLHQQAEAKK